MTDSAPDYGASGAKPDFMLSDWEQRVREVVLNTLRTPSSLPAEFRAWLPSHIETSNVQIPLSQVVGAFLTGTKTEQLRGKGVNGRPAMVRTGAAPYDFFHLVYDGAYDKWVSHWMVVLAIETGLTTTDTNYELLGNGEAPAIAIPWADFDDAGLKPQFRFNALLWSAGASVARATLLFYPYNSGDAFTTLTPATWNVQVTGTTPKLVDSGWQEIPAMTPKDMLLVGIGLQTSNVANAATIGSASSVMVRWVSK